MNTTNLEDLLKVFDNETIKEDEQVVDEQTDEGIVFDFTLPLEVRMKSLSKLFSEQSDEVINTIRKLTTIYLVSPVTLLQQFLYEISLHSSLPIDIRIECLECLAFDPLNKGDLTPIQQKGYDGIIELLERGDMQVLPAPIQVDKIMDLYNRKYNVEKYLKELFENQKINIRFRYKTLTSLQKRLTLKLFHQFAFEFMYNGKNEIHYRILIAQHLLYQGDLKDEQTVEIEHFLINVLHQPYEDNIYSIVCDTLLNSSNSRLVSIARDKLRELGGTSASIYHNKQNVHSESIESSVKSIVEELFTHSLPTTPFKDIKKDLMTIAVDMYRKDPEIPETEEKSLDDALFQVEVDSTMFKGINRKLISVLSVLYSYIETQEYAYEIKRRLVEELVDAEGWCSSGYISRMVNCLSGFGEHSLTISWQDQISSNLLGRLNNLIRQTENTEMVFYEAEQKWYSVKQNENGEKYFTPDHTRYEFETKELTEEEMDILVRRGEDVVEKLADHIEINRNVTITNEMKHETRINVLLEQMTNVKLDDRREFLRFFRENISDIRQDLWMEFRDHIKDEEFDMSFRAALIHYEGN